VADGARPPAEGSAASLERPGIYGLAEEVFARRIPFNRLLGLHVESIEAERASMRFMMRAELVGNYERGILHGGVSAAALDVTGGLVAFVNMVKRLEDVSMEDALERFSRMGTIDMRVDFLRPGAGEYFIASAHLLRSGNRIVVTRSELHNDEGDLLASGTATYIVG
jgi:uncharacterized protein (TIGR00369 family)